MSDTASGQPSTATRACERDGSCLEIAAEAVRAGLWRQLALAAHDRAGRRARLGAAGDQAGVEARALACTVYARLDLALPGAARAGQAGRGRGPGSLCDAVSGDLVKRTLFTLRNVQQ